MEWLSSVFLGVFVFGLIFCLASLLLGFTHLALDGHGLHLDGSVPHAHGLHTGHDAPGVDLGPADPTGGAAPAGVDLIAPTVQSHLVTSHGVAQVSPWNLTAILAFVTWFGGAGYLALTLGGVGLLFAVLAAVVAGLIGWSIISLFLSRVLLKAERPMDPADYCLEGTVARVTAPIGAECSGEIVYPKGGALRSDGARSVDGRPIERGTEVVVVRYERGLAYVEPWGSFVEGEARPAR